MPRAIRGVVAAVKLIGRVRGERIAFCVRIVPRLRLLEHRTNRRIFQEKSVPEIVEILLREQGVRSSWRLHHEHPARIYTVQHRETDLAFALRLLA